MAAEPAKPVKGIDYRSPGKFVLCLKCWNTISVKLYYTEHFPICNVSLEPGFYNFVPTEEIDYRKLPGGRALCLKCNNASYRYVRLSLNFYLTNHSRYCNVSGPQPRTLNTVSENPPRNKIEHSSD